MTGYPVEGVRHSEALMDQLRESLLLERANKLYHIAHRVGETQGVNLIRDMLRITRDEGIAVGLDQKARFADQLEKVS